MRGLVLIAISLFFFSCQPDENEGQQEEKLRPVRYGQVVKSGGTIGQKFSGSIQSGKVAKLSFKVAGTINRLNVKVGDQVRNGSLIASLEPQDYNVQFEQAQAQLKSAETQIKSAESQLLNSRSTYARIEKLYESNSVSLSEFEQAKTGLEAAEAQYNAAVAQANVSKAQVSSAQNQVKYSRLTAPFSGIITMLNAEENELIGTGTPVASLMALDEPEVSVGVPEIFISRVQKGQSVNIEFSVIKGQKFTGKVTEVGFSSNSGSTYPVIITIDNPGSEVRPGMAATVEFVFEGNKEEPSKLVAPITSVGEGADGNFVFVLKKEGDAYLTEKKNVKVGKLLANGFEILEGLEDGDLVATAGLNSLLDNMRVSLSDR